MNLLQNEVIIRGLNKNNGMMILRRAKIEDLDDILNLISDGSPPGVKISPTEKSDKSYVEVFHYIDQQPTYLLAVVEVDQRIIATFQLVFLAFLAGGGAQDCQIESVHVARDFRGLGIGGLMIEWVIQLAKQHKCRRVQLTTNKSRVDPMKEPSTI
ncbi:MAG: GNAT family N-acetyltransferase [Proteobacteria bacterium]|nr:GNAT family N-acetyltransferase [Pseudomonadota bacterium]